MIGLYIAYTIPIFLRWRMGDAFEPGPWTLGAKYKWVNLIAFVWVALCVVIFCLPFTPAGVFFKHGFSWSAVNYAPLVTIGVMVAVTIWYVVSARNTFKGPIRTIDARRGRRRRSPSREPGLRLSRRWLSLRALQSSPPPRRCSRRCRAPASRRSMRRCAGAGGASGVARARARRAGGALHALADALAAHHEELALLEARNAGKPIADARGEMGMVVDTFRYYAGAPERLLGDTIPVAGGAGVHRARAARRRRPDRALELPADDRRLEARARARRRQHGRAQAGGADAADARCASPRSRSRPGSRTASSTSSSAPAARAAQRLVEHPDVAKIAFTGSTEVGRSIAAGAAATIKRVTLELGGKSPNLVFADADLEAAAAAAPMAVFGNAGQDCCARSRILVQAAGAGPRSWRCSSRTWARSGSAIRSTRRPRWGR